MLKMVLHCHASTGPMMHGLTDMLKNARTVADQGMGILKALQQFPCSIHR
jgi:hypothetical protein